MDLLEAKWTALLRALRPGSRIVLWNPKEQELCLEFARRGFRIMLLHGDKEFVVQCRSSMREVGLASQLMGSHLSEPGKVPSLAKDFYDIFLFCQGPTIQADEVAFCLSPGGMLVFPTEEEDPPKLGPRFEPVERIPASFVAFRRINRPA